MQITKFADYSLRILIYLAADESGQATAKKVAESYGISVHHVAKAAQWLVHEGHVTATRGKGGGLSLARAPENISIGEVIRRAEEGSGLVDCMRGDGGCCVIAGACGLASILKDAQEAFFAVLDRRSLADAIRRPETIAELLSLLTVSKAHA